MGDGRKKKKRSENAQLTGHFRAFFSELFSFFFVFFNISRTNS